MTFGHCTPWVLGYRCDMHLRRGYLGWGVFLILAGAVPLLVRSGYLTDDQIGRLWNLWPLILIGIGVGLVLGRTRFDFVGGLIVAATFGLMVGGLLSTGVDTISTGACGSDSGTVAFPARDGSLSTDGGSVDVQLDCGDVTVAVASGNAWRVEGQDADGKGPDIESGDRSLKVRSRDGDGGPIWVFGKGATWRITLPDAPRLDVDLQLSAGSATVALGGAALGTVDLELNAGSATFDLTSVREIKDIQFRLNAGSLGLTLPNLSMTGSIEANAGSVRLCVPPGAALNLRTGESIIGSYDYAGHGLVQDGSTWTTPGFDSAAVRIELRTVANAGSFALDPEGGCD
jgi:hypothetical protein